MPSRRPSIPPERKTNVKTLSLDLETYSSTDLSQTGVHKYAQSRDFLILLCAFAIDDGPVRVLDLMSSEEDRQFFNTDIREKLFDFAFKKTAYNASFELECLKSHFSMTSDEYERMLNGFSCSMAQAAYCGLPIGLSGTGAALGLPEDKKKYAIGKKLIDIFCKPSKKALAGERVLPAQEPEKWDLFKAYCAQDVAAERAIATALSAPDARQGAGAVAAYLPDERPGVAVDLDMVMGAISITASEDARLRLEGQALGMDNPNSLPQLKAAVNEALAGVETVSSLNKANVEALADKYPDNEQLQALLSNRLQGGKSSLAKYPAIFDSAIDSRVHDVTMYYGASRNRPLCRKRRTAAKPAAQLPGQSVPCPQPGEAREYRSRAAPVWRCQGHAQPAHPHGLRAGPPAIAS